MRLRLDEAKIKNSEMSQMRERDEPCLLFLGFIFWFVSLLVFFIFVWF
jgi:hypothetical protein